MTFGLFGKPPFWSINYCSCFLTNFGKYWATFYSIIWSHCGNKASSVAHRSVVYLMANLFTDYFVSQKLFHLELIFRGMSQWVCFLCGGRGRQPVWPDLVKFRHFDKILIVFGKFWFEFVLKTFAPALWNFMLLSWFKRQKIEKYCEAFWSHWRRRLSHSGQIYHFIAERDFFTHKNTRTTKR